MYPGILPQNAGSPWGMACQLGSIGPKLLGRQMRIDGRNSVQFFAWTTVVAR